MAQAGNKQAISDPSRSLHMQQQNQNDHRQTTPSKYLPARPPPEDAVFNVYKLKTQPELV